jgi:hypothetical protein
MPRPGIYPPVISHGEFGNLLARLFDPAVSVVFNSAGWDTVGGHQMYVFAYRVPQEQGYLIEKPKGEGRVAFGGFVYAGFETKAVIRIELECSDFPLTSIYRHLDLTLNYRPTTVAGWAASPHSSHGTGVSRPMRKSGSDRPVSMAK